MADTSKSDDGTIPEVKKGEATHTSAPTMPTPVAPEVPVKQLELKESIGASSFEDTKKLVEDKEVPKVILTDKEKKDLTIDTVKDEVKNFLSSPEAKNFIKETAKEEVEQRISQERVSQITVFGIFATIVTFLSVEIQILKVVCDFWKLLGLSGFVLGAMLIFILFLMDISKRTEHFKYLFCMVISILLLSFSALFVASDEYSCKEAHFNTTIDNKLSEWNKAINETVDTKLDIGLKDVNAQVSTKVDDGFKALKSDITEYVEQLVK